jgi:organic radical activating enzyme
MPASIISTHPKSPFSDLTETLSSFQSTYPADWFYKPVGIEVEITNKCNLQCAGCGQRDEQIRPEDILDTQEYIDAIQSARTAGIRACSITGGETLMFLERVKQILTEVDDVDFFKINSNGYRFFNDHATVKLLQELRSRGFGTKNRYIKPVFVISVGQQNQAGIALIHAVNLVKNFYDVFSFDEAICTINITDQNIQSAHRWKKAFLALYKKTTGAVLDQEKVPIRTFMLNNIPTLQRLGLISRHVVPIRELLHSYKQQYTSWTCLNLLPEDVEDLTTLTPKCVLRPNGDLIACPGYNYVHKIGNVREKSVREILEDANQNPFLRTVFTKGLLGVLDEVKKTHPEIEKEKLSISYAPCDVCQYLRDLR